MTAGQLARRAGVGVETLRYYEQRGLLERPARTGSGYRVYDEASLKRLRFIGRAKGVGFTLAETKELLSLRSRPAPACAGVKKQAEAKIAEIDAKVALLLRTKQVLERLFADCAERGDCGRCLVLEALDGVAADGADGAGPGDLPDRRGPTRRGGR
jgi:MerR family mercuric resistance operon transcriptional regulator